jgi:hypothetical protein
MKKLLALFLALALWAGFCTPAQAVQYANGVTKGTVTIASGASTGSTSIGAPTGTWVLFYNGCTTSATTSNAQARGYLSIDGSNNVVATRGTTAGSSTITCAFSALDATSNLVASVQRGTISLTTASNTATISAVTLADSAVFWLGQSETLTSFHYDCNTTTATLTNTTTVTGNILQTGCVSGTTVMAFQVVNWNHSALNQNTQPFSKSWTASGTSTTQTITSVDVNNSLIAYAGGGSTNGNTDAREMPWYTLTNGTTVTITLSDASGNPEIARGTVNEFVSGVLTQNAQRGTTVISAGSNSNTSAITSADTARTSVNWTGWTTTEILTTSHAAIKPRMTQSDATTMTGNTNTNVTAGDTVTQGWEAHTWETSGGGGGDTSNASSMFLAF